MEGRASIVIVHRLSTIRDCGLLFVINSCQEILDVADELVVRYPLQEPLDILLEDLRVSVRGNGDVVRDELHDVVEDLTEQSHSSPYRG